MLLQRRLPINGDIDIGDVYAWYGHAIPSAFAEVVEGLAAGTLKARPQDEKDATYAFPRRIEDGRLDFTCPAGELHRLVRASSRPFAGAFCAFEGTTKVKVWKASVVALPGVTLGVPGQVLDVDVSGRPTVLTGDGALRFDEFEPDAAITIGRRSRFT